MKWIQDIVQYLRNKYNLLVGEGIAEQVKWKIGSAYSLQPEKTMEVRGRNLVTGSARKYRDLFD